MGHRLDMPTRTLEVQEQYNFNKIIFCVKAKDALDLPFGGKSVAGVGGDVIFKKLYWRLRIILFLFACFLSLSPSPPSCFHDTEVFLIRIARLNPKDSIHFF